MIRTKKLPNYWQPIGGGINVGELPIDAVIRELHEETGLMLKFKDFLKIIEVPYDFGNGTVHCYSAEVIIADAMLKINNQEIAESQWFTLKKARFLPMF